jgi:hypothetical protein
LIIASAENWDITGIYLRTYARDAGQGDPAAA